jgi:ABC-2 type transport system ATP-binding protein
MDAIVTRGLTKEYRQLGRRARRSLDNLSISIREGEVFGFLGHNGAGKTTTIKILAGLVKPTAGEAMLFGESTRHPAARRRLGYLPEQPYFYEYLTPRETIEFYARLRGRSTEERAADWEYLSRLLDLRDIAHQPIKSFSKGMRQRIGFAVALVGNPPLLILDEPMSGLDPVGRRNIRELILRCRDEGKTLFFSSHVLGDVEQICDRVSILSQGKLIREGRIDQLVGSEAYGVEIVARGLDGEGAARAQALADSHRRVDELHVFTTTSKETGNEIVRLILERGAELAEYTPLKESLEAYFMREQDAAAAREGGRA